MMKRRIVAGVAALGLALSLAACSGGGGRSATGDGGSSTDNKGALVGVAMPTKVSERWIKDGDAVKSALEEKGYKVDLEYADNKIPQQVQQVSNMITKGAKVLIVASIDGGSLSDQLDSAAKAGMHGFTMALAQELANKGVTVNTVSPGYIGTDMTKAALDNEEWKRTWLEMTPMGRVGEPADIAHAVLYLASDAARFATGTNLVVDGGYTAW